MDLVVCCCIRTGEKWTKWPSPSFASNRKRIRSNLLSSNFPRKHRLQGKQICLLNIRNEIWRRSVKEIPPWFFRLKNIKNPQKAIRVILSAVESVDFNSTSIVDQSGKIWKYWEILVFLLFVFRSICSICSIFFCFFFVLHIGLNICAENSRIILL